MNTIDACTRSSRHLGVPWSGSNTPHVAQFYESDDYLCRSIAAFIAPGIGAGEPAIIIATGPHRSSINEQLRERSIDVERAIASELLTLLDAETVLARLMRDGAPDRDAFEAHIGGLVRRVRSAREERPVRAYGEMVDLLWKAGKQSAALELEELWNGLAKTETFSLVCGYSMTNFPQSEDAEAFRSVCEAHSHAMPAESFAALPDEAARLRQVSVLQQQAAALLSEVAQRRELEGLLRDRDVELRDFLESSSEGIHLVGPDGTILYANKAELEMLGYSAAEYIGRPITDFHVDRPVIEDILNRLCRGDTLTNYEARLLCKDGSIKHVLINSNVHFRDGEFIHTRCFTRDITERKKWEERLRIAEERFRKMAEASPDGIGVTVPVRERGDIVDFRYIYVNPVVAKAMRRPAEELIGRTLLEVLPGLDETPFWRAFCRVATSGQHEIYEQPYDQNGWHGWYRNVVISLGDELAVVYSDITEQKRAQASLHFLAEASSVLGSSLDYDTTLASVAKLAVPAIADWASVDLLTPDGQLKRIAVAHLDPRKVELAHELEARFPIDLQAPNGVGYVVRSGQSELVPEITEEFLAAAIADKELLGVVKALGLVSSICVPLRARGRAIGAITLVSAESGRRYTNDDLQLAEELARRAGIAVENATFYKAAEDASRAKDEFLAVVSHELRTPLNAILGWVHMLLDGSLSEERRRRALETIERNARAQNQLIEDLLDVSRIVSGKLRLDVDAVDLPLVIERAVETIRPAAAAKDITIRQIIDPAATPVFGDADRLQQVVWNLLSNAVKFSVKASSIQVVLRRLESSVEIIVKDNGRGIEPAFLPYVFERFRQADSGTTRAKGGLGLGLAIVRNLVELHGGTVRAESEGPDRGATFSVRLPISPLRPASFTRPPALHMTSVAPSVACPSDLQNISVLVVDDEQDARELLAELLGSCGAKVHVAASVAEALRLVEQHRPTIVVSDIGMPEEDGYAFIRKLRALPPAHGGSTPAVALTAYTRAEERTKALVAGYNMHVPKPVEPAELLAVLASLTAVLKN